MPRSAAMSEALAIVAPGRPLREGLDRILQAERGALILVGDGPEVLSVCTGGFLVDAEFSPQRLSELAKMDGAIILTPDADRIARANVHLTPDPAVPTTETGTRHRTAERIARTIDVPVISVSEDMSIIDVYRGDEKHPLEAIPHLLDRANQALQTLSRYKDRLEHTISSLSALEVEDLVTVRDVATVLQRAEMVRRIAEEIHAYLIELGKEGRLLQLQLDELMGGVDDDRRLVVRDYVSDEDELQLGQAAYRLASLPTSELLDIKRVARVLGLSTGDDLDATLDPRGYRLLSHIPRLPEGVIEEVVRRFVSLQATMRATVAELDSLDGVTVERARNIKEGLSRLTEASILDRYA